MWIGDDRWLRLKINKQTNTLPKWKNLLTLWHQSHPKVGMNFQGKKVTLPSWCVRSSAVLSECLSSVCQRHVWKGNESNYQGHHAICSFQSWDVSDKTPLRWTNKTCPTFWSMWLTPFFSGIRMTFFVSYGDFFVSGCCFVCLIFCVSLEKSKRVQNEGTCLQSSHLRSHVKDV